MRALALMLLFLTSAPVQAQSPDLRAIVQTHVIAGYRSLVEEAADLADTADAECSVANTNLVPAFHDAFDAWVRVSHLRFGPSEREERAFALAFWPDPRGSTLKALAGLIRNQDKAVLAPGEFTTVSVAARGFYALEYLLFDPQFASSNGPFHCALVQAITADIATNAQAILEDWQGGFGAEMMNPENGTYRSTSEAHQQFFTALLSGLEFTSDVRLGRPMGTFERPRPNRAEARRSGRSLRHVVLSLEATEQLAGLLSGEDPDIAGRFQAALERALALNDPIFASVAKHHGRFQVEVLQQKIDEIRDILTQELGPRLGISAGFNALDGD